ncbi:MAG TPA: cyclic nucleotide-binding domain-containing protein [Candidatus Acidoferrum sp.]|nr:cyclic nucleotide-binding domain-containing protein [Candidatus Acidoferrum sp.]
MAESTLQELTRNDWTLFESKARPINFSLGQEIIQEGARIDHVCILRRGSASVELNGTHSNAILATLVAGDICGEMAFLGDSRATVGVVAKEEVEADVIWADDLRQLISTFPAFGVRYDRSPAIILGQRLRQTSKELLREMTKNGSELALLARVPRPCRGGSPPEIHPYPVSVHDLTGISTSCNVEQGEDVSVYPIGAPLCRLMQLRPCVVWKTKSVDSVLTLPLQKMTRKSGPFWPSSKTHYTSTSNAFDRVFPTIQSSLSDAPETRFQKTRDSFSALHIDGRYWVRWLLAFDVA